MIAVYLHTASLGLDWVGLVFALAAVGALGFLAPRGRKLLLGLAVAGLLAYTATSAEAVYVNCPELWRYLGIC